MTLKDSILLTNIGDLVTNAPLSERGNFSTPTMADLGRIQNAWLYAEKGKIHSFGKMPAPNNLPSEHVINVKGALVTPGLIDPHTHAIFAGSRAHEFVARLSGESYQSICAQGGGIKYTVKCTREASDSELKEILEKNLRRFLTHGVCTVEVKSGYGLNVKEELRLLKIINSAMQVCPQSIVRTCLAAHAVMPDYKNAAEYLDACCTELLPQIANEKLADYVDAFVEQGYFSPAELNSYFATAKKLGLAVRIHADEFKDSGAAKAAADWQAHSADHLEEASENGIQAMAQSGTVAVLLPGTSIYTKIPYANAAKFRTAGVPIALATDFNPGSCQIDNLPLVASIGALHCGLNLAEAFSAVTIVAARSLRLEKVKGALAKGYDADFLIHDLSHLEEWIADFGSHKPKSVFINGKLIS